VVVDAERGELVNYPLGDPCDTAPLENGEEALWCVYNRTFHRPNSYGLVLTARALYVYRPLFFYIRRWRRIAIEAIADVTFVDSSRRPALHVRTAQGTTIFRAPAYDGDDEELAFNRDELRRTIRMIDDLKANRGVQAPMQEI
jgi:hypothetical protein